MHNKLPLQIKFLTFFAFMFLISTCNHAFALSIYRPLPQPNCKISGIIKAVTFQPGTKDVVSIDDEYKFPSLYTYPDTYYFEIETDSVSYINGDTTLSTCENKYPINKKSIIFIEKNNIKNGDVFSVGQKISGIVDGDMSLNSSYVLIKNNENEQTLKPKNPEKDILEISEISKKLIDEKYVHYINNIWLQPEQQIYKVEASKKVKIFLFIPINYNFEIIVDAKTGNINSIEKKWWVSLLGF